MKSHILHNDKKTCHVTYTVLQFLRELQKGKFEVRKVGFSLSSESHNKLFVIATLVLTFIFTQAAFCYAEDQAPAQDNFYTMTVNGEPIMIVESKEIADAAIESLAQDMVPENATFASYSVEENLDYVELPKTDGMLRSNTVADDKSEVKEILEKKIQGTQPTLHITVKSNKYKSGTLPLKVKFKYKKNMYDFEFKLKSKGNSGKTKTRYELTSVNGAVQSKVKKETKTVKKMKYRVILTGRKKTPKDMAAKKFKKYKKKVIKQTYKTYGDIFLGINLVNFGKKFVGNPYRVGGKSLTHGIDCVQFVRALYRHFGINLPENRHKLFKTGKVVPYSKARPGDVVFYGKHPAIYMGNGKIISARKKGISISRIGYKKWTYIRRMK